MDTHTLPASAIRPRRLAAVVAADVVLGLLGITGGVGSLLAAGALPQPQGLGFLQPLAPVFPLVLIILGAFLLVTSVGLWHGWRWALTATLVFEIVHIVADIGFIADRSFAVDKLVGLALIVAILVYLTRPSVRAYFGRTGS